MQLIITADPTSVAEIIWKKFSATMSLDLGIEMRRFFERRGKFVQNMNNAGFYGCDNSRKYSRSNMLYFPCEAVETRIMSGALQTMLKHKETRSLVWLHDGMYVNENIPQDFTRKAFQQSAREIGIEHLDVKITKCSDALAELPTSHLLTSSQALVDQVEEAIGRLENCTNKEGKRATIDLDKPLGKQKGAVYKAKR